ncbi:MAG TPA: MarR family transcriptional regulator [Spirochaetales bacterium]|nr:MarR family transcriptional regulator [Spirochaetales bacterium]
MKRTDNAPRVDRKTADELLYGSLRAVYHFERSLVERFGLGYQEIYLLQLLRRRETARIGEIADALGVKMFTMSRLVSRLRDRGYVSKAQDSGDRRGILVGLEPRGDELVAAIEKANYELVIGSLSRLTTAEQSAFVVVAENLDEALGVADRTVYEP